MHLTETWQTYIGISEEGVEYLPQEDQRAQKEVSDANPQDPGA